MKPVAFASHTLTSAEQIYAQIEKSVSQQYVPVKSFSGTLWVSTHNGLQTVSTTHKLARS
jgi:hypothetical protein